MRTPGQDAELAAGFLLTEGMIHNSKDLLRLNACAHNRNILHVQLSPAVPIDFERLTRHVFASSSCGLCGKATIDAVRTQFPAIRCGDFQISPDIVASLPDTMRAHQSTFDRTGGLHAAGIFNSRGELIVLHEDVGRLNAVDKVVGHCLLQDFMPLDRHILLVSGRSSFEIMQKALAARIPIVAAVSAPSSLAVEFAVKSGETLLVFLRGIRMNIYTHIERVRHGELLGDHMHSIPPALLAASLSKHHKPMTISFAEMGMLLGGS